MFLTKRIKYFPRWLLMLKTAEALLSPAVCRKFCAES